MTTQHQIPTVASLRERVADGLSPALIAELPRLVTARIHAHGAERVPLFMIASFCRFLETPIAEHGDDAERLAEADRRFVPAISALLDGVERELSPAEMFGLLDAAVTAAAGANRALAMGEGAGGHP